MLSISLYNVQIFTLTIIINKTAKIVVVMLLKTLMFTSTIIIYKLLLQQSLFILLNTLLYTTFLKTILYLFTLKNVFLNNEKKSKLNIFFLFRFATGSSMPGSKFLPRSSGAKATILTVTQSWGEERSYLWRHHPPIRWCVESWIQQILSVKRILTGTNLILLLLYLNLLSLSFVVT